MDFLKIAQFCIIDPKTPSRFGNRVAKWFISSGKPRNTVGSKETSSAIPVWPRFWTVMTSAAHWLTQCKLKPHTQITRLSLKQQACFYFTVDTRNGIPFFQGQSHGIFFKKMQATPLLKKVMNGINHVSADCLTVRFSRAVHRLESGLG